MQPGSSPRAEEFAPEGIHGARPPSSMFGALGGLIVAGLAIRITFSLGTSLPGDVAVWWQVIQRTKGGVGLYTLTGYSYPPLYGYYLMAVSALLHFVDLGPQLLGHVLNSGTQPLAVRAFGNIVTSPLGTLVVKLPMIVADLGTGWCIWRTALLLGAGDGEAVRDRNARRAFLWWWLNPVVIFTSTIHGQIDSIASFAIALTVLAVVRRQWLLVGGAIALGVAVKLVPFFLVFTVFGFVWGNKKSQRCRTLAIITIGGMCAGLLFMGPELSSSFIANVFTRASVGVGLGGIGITGLLHFNGSSGLLTWCNQHAVFFNNLLFYGELAAGVAIGIRVMRRPTVTSFISGTLLLFTLVVATSSVANPQYLLWFLPLAALSMSGYLGSTTIYRRGLLLLIAAPLYVFGYFGWRSLLAPLQQLSGWPSSTSTVQQLQGLVAVHQPTWFVSQWFDRWLFLSTVLVLPGMVFLLREASQGHRGTGFDVVKLLTPPPLRPSRGSRAIVGAILATEALGVWAPLLAGNPKVAFSVNRTASIATIDGGSSSSGGTRMTTFPVDPTKNITQINIIGSAPSTFSYSTLGNTLGIAQELGRLLQFRDPSLRIATITNQQWRSLMLQPKVDTHVLIIDVWGVLPDSVYGFKNHILQHWLARGGRMVFAGNVAGYYAGGRRREVMGLRGLFREPIYVATNWQRSPAKQQSVWSQALSLTSVGLQFGIDANALRKFGGVVVGQLDGQLTAEGFAPIGLGGVLCIGGTLTRLSTESFATDLVQILASDWFAQVGPVRTINLTPKHHTIDIAVSPRNPTYVVFFSNPEFPLWSKTIIANI